MSDTDRNREITRRAMDQMNAEAWQCCMEAFLPALVEQPAQLFDLLCDRARWRRGQCGGDDSELEYLRAVMGSLKLVFAISDSESQESWQ